MFNLEKREKFILLTLLASLLLGLVFGLYQKRAIHIDVKSSNLTPLEKQLSSLTGFASSAEDPPVATPKINVNEADAEELMKLKGVGKVLAGRIIEYRAANGNFISIEDLKRVKGLGGKLYEKIKDEISID